VRSVRLTMLLGGALLAGCGGGSHAGGSGTGADPSTTSSTPKPSATTPARTTPRASAKPRRKHTATTGHAAATTPTATATSTQATAPHKQSARKRAPATHRQTTTPQAKKTHRPAPAKPPARKPRKPAVPSGPLVARLSAPGHSPKVGDWPITVTLTKGGRPVRGHISYVFLLDRQVVGKQPVGKPPVAPGGARSPNFVGRFHDVLIWPARAVGIPLTLRVVVKSAYGTRNLDWAVKVHR
jgi:hypothetical protein